jgi:hypothetical protein
MKTGFVSGCVVWFILFGITSSCLIPVGLLAASLTSQTEFVAESVGAYLCPTGTQPGLYTYPTTMRSSSGVDRPATGSELICLDANGETVVNLGPTYAFIWTGVLGLVGALAAAILSVLLAWPVGAFFARRFGNKADSFSAGQ